MTDEPRARVTLSGVPETLLWTLWFRATEARRSDPVLADPLAVELVDRIDFPFHERFGAANPLQAQGQALRALRFDLEVRPFLARHPDGQVVALGEGLETQLWRVDNGRLRWLSVDLPETIDVRRRVLPPHDRARLIASSVLDPGWLGELPTGAPVLFTAQGLLMYLEPEQVHALITRLAHRSPGSSLVLDTVPAWFSARTRAGLRGAAGYQAPPMPWGVDAGERRRLAELTGVRTVERLALPRGRGVFFGGLRPLTGGRLPHLLQYLAPWGFLRLELDGQTVTP